MIFWRYLNVYVVMQPLNRHAIVMPVVDDEVFKMEKN